MAGEKAPKLHTGEGRGRGHISISICIDLFLFRSICIVNPANPFGLAVQVMLLAIAFSPAIPLLLPFAAVFLAISYGVDRYNLLRVLKVRGTRIIIGMNISTTTTATISSSRSSSSSFGIFFGSTRGTACCECSRYVAPVSLLVLL